jgi:hypothetical protein
MRNSSGTPGWIDNRIAGNCVGLDQISPIRNPKRHQTTEEMTKRLIKTSKRPPTKDSLNRSHTCTQKFSKNLIFNELNGLKKQIEDINSKIQSNITILREKQEKNKQLKIIIEKIEEKNILTDTSYEQDNKNWSCSINCILF